MTLPKQSQQDKERQKNSVNNSNDLSSCGRQSHKRHLEVLLCKFYVYEWKKEHRIRGASF